MAKRLRKMLAVLAVAALAIVAFALPALAWGSNTNYAAGFTLIPEDTSLFQGLKMSRNNIYDWGITDDERHDIEDMAWKASGLTGTRGVMHTFDDIFLVSESTGERVDLTAPENAALANAQVTLQACKGWYGPECTADNISLVRYDSQTNTCSKQAYVSIETKETIVNGVARTEYYYVLKGRLIDVLGCYCGLDSIADDEPVVRAVSYDPRIEHNYWLFSVETGEHVSFKSVSEAVVEDGYYYNPALFTKIDGTNSYRFDAELGLKFIAPADEGWVPVVTYTTADGVTTKLLPTGETYWDYNTNKDCNVYQMPPTDGPVTINLSSREVEATVNGDGTVDFTENYYPTAYRVSFNLPQGVSFKEASDVSYSSSMRTAFAVANPAATVTGGYDYYCWPDKASRFSFTVPEGYIVTGATVTPEGAGTATVYQSNGIASVSVKLNGLATVTLSMEKIQHSYVKTDLATGISAAITFEDIGYIFGSDNDWDATTLRATPVTDASEIAKIRATIIDSLEDGDDFSPNEIVAYDVRYISSEGYEVLGFGSIGLLYGAQVTIPLPNGWDAETTRVYQFYDAYWEGEHIISADERTAVPSADGKSLVVFAPRNFCCFVLTCEEASTPAHAPGWAKENGGYYYYENDGTLRKNAWISYGGSWYYLGADGKLVVNGWAPYGGKNYYMGANGKVTTNSWVKDGGKYYYMNGSGVATTGWASIGGSYYYFNADGTCLTNGWAPYQGKNYFMGADGKVVTNKFVNYEGSYYYINGSGNAVVNDWVYYGGKYYHMDEAGHPETNKWIQYGNVWYHVGANGAVDNSWRG